MKQALLFLLLLSSGCSLMQPRQVVPEVKPVEIITIEKPAPVYHPPFPNEIQFNPVEWKVLTPETMDVYLTELRSGEVAPQAWYGLTSKGYENLSGNMADIKRYLRQVLSVVQYYRELDESRSEVVPTEKPKQ